MTRNTDTHSITPSRFQWQNNENRNKKESNELCLLQRIKFIAYLCQGKIFSL